MSSLTDLLDYHGALTRSGDSASIENHRQLMLKASARIAELEAVIDSIEKDHGFTADGNLWRFWSKMASNTSVENTKLGFHIKLLIQAAENIRKWANPSGVDPEIDADYHTFDKVLAQVKDVVK